MVQTQEGRGMPTPSASFNPTHMSPKGHLRLLKDKHCCLIYFCSNNYGEIDHMTLLAIRFASSLLQAVEQFDGIGLVRQI
jgi:hypothetical protein